MPLIRTGCWSACMRMGEEDELERGFQIHFWWVPPPPPPPENPVWRGPMRAGVGCADVCVCVHSAFYVQNVQISIYRREAHMFSLQWGGGEGEGKVKMVHSHTHTHPHTPTHKHSHRKIGIKHATIARTRGKTASLRRRRESVDLAKTIRLCINAAHSLAHRHTYIGL